MNLLPPQRKALVARFNGIRNAGFTLVELMIVIAIILTLTAVAYPMYEAYLIRSRYSAVLAEVSAHKSAVVERYIHGEKADYKAIFGPSGGVTPLCELPHVQIPAPDMHGKDQLIVIGCYGIRGWSQGRRPARMWINGRVDHNSGSISWDCYYGVDGVSYKYTKHAPKRCIAGGGTPDA